MLKRLLGHDKEAREGEKEKAIVIDGQQEEVEEAVNFLSTEDKKAVERVIDEVETVVKEATKESLKALKLLEEGNCPDCGRKVRQLKGISACPFCGWSSYITPDGRATRVHLLEEGCVECDSTFEAKEEILCITDQVVKAIIPKENVLYTEYLWREGTPAV